MHITRMSHRAATKLDDIVDHLGIAPKKGGEATSQNGESRHIVTQRKLQLQSKTYSSECLWDV